MNTDSSRKSVGIWIRVSTDDQAQGDSPEHHEKRARGYAEAKGWVIAEVYRLEGVSGKDARSHPEAERMLEDVKGGRITGLIFSKLARLARSTKDLLEYADYFRNHGADLISLQESIDTSTPAGRLFYTVIAAMAQWEREEIAERVAASVPIRAKLGKTLGGAATFGYRWHEGKLVPDPDEAPVRRLIYELYIKDRRLRTVARTLNEMGHRTRRGAEFSDTTVRRLLRDPTAKGIRRANYTRSSGDGKHWEVKPEEEWVHVPVEPIVSEELWDEANAIMDAQRQPKRALGKRPVHLFAGVAFCSCGHKMYVPSNTPKYVCSKCRNKIPIEDLEGVFHEQLRSFYLSEEETAAYLAQADEKLHERTELLETARAEAEKVQGEMDQMYDLYRRGETKAEGFGRRYIPLEEQLYQLEEEIPRLEGEVDALRVQLLSSDAMLEDARDLFERWPDLPFEDRRHVVENIVERVEVGDGEVEIHLAYLPPSSETMTQRQRSVRGSSRPRAGIARDSSRPL